MIIWSGYGFLVAVFAFAFALAANFGFDAIFGQGYYVAHKWTAGVAMLLAAVVTWLVAAWLRGPASRVAVDKETGQEMVLDRPNHTLFFIPMHFWGPILAVIGIGLCLMEVVQ